MICGKLNVASKPAVLACAINNDTLMFESGSVDITADEVLAPQCNIEAPQRNRAVEWLKELLSGGKSMSSNEILRLAAEEDFSETTIKRAKKEIGVKSYIEFDDDGEKCWYCKLPKAEGEQLKLPTLSEMYAKLNKMTQNIKLPKTTI